MGRKQIAYKRPPGSKRAHDKGHGQPQVPPSPQPVKRQAPDAADEQPQVPPSPQPGKRRAADEGDEQPQAPPSPQSGSMQSPDEGDEQPQAPPSPQPGNMRAPHEGDGQPQVPSSPQQEYPASPSAVHEEDDASGTVSLHVKPSLPSASQIQPYFEPTGGIVLGLPKLTEGNSKPTAARGKRTRPATVIKEQKKQKTGKGKASTDAAGSEATRCTFILEWIERQRDFTKEQKKLLRDNFGALGESQVDGFESEFRKIRKAELQLIASHAELGGKFVESVLNVIKTEAS